MKTLREIQDEVAIEYGFGSYDFILQSYKNDVVSWNFINDYLYDCFIEVQRQAQLKIEKRVEDDFSNSEFGYESIVNELNIIR